MNKKLEALLLGAALAAAPLASEARGPGGPGGHCPGGRGPGGWHGPAPMHHMPRHPHGWGPGRVWYDLEYEAWLNSRLYFSTPIMTSPVITTPVITTPVVSTPITYGAVPTTYTYPTTGYTAAPAQPAVSKPTTEMPALEPGDTVEKRPDGTVIIKKAAAPVYQDNQNVRQQ